ncbi:MAG: orotate phosphoribosyltransferase [Holophagaceae bacterium]|nr:orotate phosphoribosyltransferase [Holophagaceae bacterium]
MPHPNPQAFDLPSSLLRAGAVRLSPDAPFTWASGLKSPIYCDNRQLLGYPQIREEIAHALAASIRGAERQPSLIAGTSTAGIPWATLVADILELPLVYVRPEPKKHGMGRQVEGPLADKHSVVLVEDLISTGMSSLKCVDALIGEGAEILEVLALFSYELPKAEASFRDKGVPWRVLATFSELASRALEGGAITKTGEKSLTEWRADPQLWSDARSQ